MPGDIPVDWLDALPTLQGLFPADSNSLLRPLSRFSLSIWRSRPSLPSPAAIHPLLSISSDILRPQRKPSVKALAGLESFTTQFQDAVRGQNLGLQHENVQERLGVLGTGYAAGGVVVSRLLWEGNESGLGEDIGYMETALKQCIAGFFAVRRLLDASSATILDSHLLGSIFPSTPPYLQSFLSPILDHCRALTAALKAHPVRSLAHSKLFVSARSPTKEYTDHEIQSLLLLLESIIVGFESVSTLESISLAPVEGKATKVKLEQKKVDDENRPLRLRMEVMLLECDLLLSATNRRIEQVKARQLRKFPKAEDRQNGSESANGDGDVKLCRRSKSKSATPEFSNAIKPDSIDTDPSSEKSLPEWEVSTEQSLISCLDFARSLVGDGRFTVLSDDIASVQWLGDGDMTTSNAAGDPTSSIVESHSDSDSDSNSDSDSYFDEDDSSSEHGDDLERSYHCPLRTLFALHDRYEEQRLAVWLSLPVDKRAKMTAWMRGEDGGVGEMWDELGVGLCTVVDGETLISYGLAPDKLDKWSDLASHWKGKKMKRGRRTGRG